MTQETPEKTNVEDAEKTLDPALDQDENQLSGCASEEVDQLKDQLLRTLAEAENTRKRAVREQEEGRKYAITSFAKDVLSVLDNLGRALDSIPEDVASESPLLENLVNGITMTQQALSTVCERHGIQKIEALGVKFDPHHHQAMFEIEGKEENVGCVVQVMQEGYQIHGRLLRPALVGVGKALTVIES